MKWGQRIHFGGLIDAPDSRGETRSQGPAMGFGIDLLSGDQSEIRTVQPCKITCAEEDCPVHSGEILMSEEFSRN